MTTEHIDHPITLADFQAEAQSLAGTRELLFLLAAAVTGLEDRIRALEQARQTEVGGE